MPSLRDWLQSKIEIVYNYFPAVDGNWGEWESYGPCSTTNGEGTQFRHRLCDSPPPANGGEGCEGVSTETLACNAELSRE